MTPQAISADHHIDGTRAMRGLQSHRLRGLLKALHRAAGLERRLGLLNRLQQKPV